MAVIENGNGTNEQSVDSGHAKAQLRDASDAAKVGAVVVYGEVTSGEDGLPRELRPIDVSHDYRTRVGVDKLRFLQDFGINSAAIVPINCGLTLATYTNATANGWFAINSANSVAANAYGHFRTRAVFNFAQSQSMYFEGNFRISAIPASGQVITIGPHSRTDSATAAPTDGVYLELTSGGVWQLVWNTNGTPTPQALSGGWTPTPNTGHYLQFVLSDKEIDLYIDGSIYASIPKPVSEGTTFRTGPQPLTFYQSNGAGALGSACQLSFGKWSVHSGDADNDRSIEMVNNSMGNWLARAPGGANASIANVTNSAAPASATLSNTTAGYTTLGGNFQFAAVAGAETDYLLFSYAVPAPASTATAKTAVITGFNISLMNKGAANSATVPTTLQFWFANGATAATLATADGANTRAATRTFLGTLSIPINAVIDQATDNIFVSLPSLICEPGTQAQIIVKVVGGAATASQVIRGVIQPLGYWDQ